MVDQYGRWFPDYPGQQPYMDPQFNRVHGQQQQPAQMAQQPSPQQQQPAAAASMTPPTIHAEIVQVSSGEQGEQEAKQYPVGAGMSQMMMSKDEEAIFIKTATPNGYVLDVYIKRPPAPEPPPFNPAEYVRLDALPGLVAEEVRAAVAAAMTPPEKPVRVKKETETAK